jgi:hypothetical protein
MLGRRSFDLALAGAYIKILTDHNLRNCLLGLAGFINVVFL